MDRKTEKREGSRIRSWLIEIREKQGLTQGRVADAAGISQPSYFGIEKGEFCPKPDTAKRIARELGFDWTRFYDDEE